MIWADALEASTHIMTSLRKLLRVCQWTKSSVPQKVGSLGKGIWPAASSPSVSFGIRVTHMWHRITKSPDFIVCDWPSTLNMSSGSFQTTLNYTQKEIKYRLYHKEAWGLSFGSWFYKLLIPEEVGHGCTWSLRNLIKPAHVSRLSFKYYGGLNFVLTPNLMVRI